MLKVVKRNGTIVDFDGMKIENAIRKAFLATSVNLPAEYVFNKIMMNIMADLNGKVANNTIHIEAIQDLSHIHIS